MNNKELVQKYVDSFIDNRYVTIATYHSDFRLQKESLKEVAQQVLEEIDKQGFSYVYNDDRINPNEVEISRLYFEVSFYAPGFDGVIETTLGKNEEQTIKYIQEVLSDNPLLRLYAIRSYYVGGASCPLHIQNGKLVKKEENDK